MTSQQISSLTHSKMKIELAAETGGQKVEKEMEGEDVKPPLV